MTDILARMSDIAIEIKGREVVSNVSLSVRRGEILGVVGETGSGKSMATRVLTGTLSQVGGRITRGSASFEKSELVNASGTLWRDLRGHRIALVPQASLMGLDPLMRIGRQLEETIHVLDRTADARNRAVELLSGVEIRDVQGVLRLYPHELSGGMRQRVMIALALAGRPDLLIADEPTTALDVSVQRRILELLVHLKQTAGLAIIFVTHDLGIVEQISDCVTVIYAGVTVESGPTSSILKAPRHPYTAALIRARPVLGRPVANEQELISAQSRPQSGCNFVPRCPRAITDCALEAPKLQDYGGASAACFRVEQ